MSNVIIITRVIWAIYFQEKCIVSKVNLNSDPYIFRLELSQQGRIEW